MLNRRWPDSLKELLTQTNVIPLEGGDYMHICPNCGGNRIMMVFVIKGGPFVSPRGGKEKWLDLPDGKSGWYTGQLEVDHCPVCQQGMGETYYREICQLEGDDLTISLADFRVDIKPVQAKADALAHAQSLLALNRATHGFTTFWGGYGVGKTHLLKGLVNGFRLIRVVAQYYLLSDLLGDIREHYANPEGVVNVEGVISILRNVRVLCIDELTRANLTPWGLETINRILDWRHAHQENVLTVMAANIAPDYFPPDLQYLASRIKSGSVLEVRGEDVRQYAAQLRRKDYDLT